MNFRGKLWQQVIGSKYGYMGQGGESGKRDGKFSKGSIWWKDLGLIDSCLVGARKWFSDGVEKKVGNGSCTLFWHNLWIDRIPLSIKYPRLYSISKGKMMEVQKLSRWIDGSWVWHRRFFVSEQELCDQLMAEIQHVRVTEDAQDSWRWRFTNIGVYSVKSAYNALVAEPVSNKNHIFKLIWGQGNPLKVSAFSWKVLYNRIATRVNLSSRGVSLTNNSSLCPICSSFEESEDHVLFTCDFATKIWKLIDHWWNMYTARRATPKDHLLQHSGLLRGRNIRRVWILIWMTAIWSIWIERNNVVFKGAAPCLARVDELIKL